MRGRASNQGTEIEILMGVVSKKGHTKINTSLL
jgi:hypothetical protein